jgi:hypothetical protein
LDEMPSAAQAAALEAIDREAIGLRVVLTTRPDGYDTARAGGRLARPAVVQLQPVDAVTAGDYLLQGHDQRKQRHQFERLARHLRAHPDSVAAGALDNPLTLTLARAAYPHPAAGDPYELTDLDGVAAVRTTLIGLFLQVAYPDQRQREHATKWLSWIAHHMDTSRDLPWWHIPRWIPRWQLRLAYGLVGGLAGALVGGLAYGPAGGLAYGLVGGQIVAGSRILSALAGVLAYGLVFGLVFGLAGGLVGEPQTMLPQRPQLRELPGLFAVGLAVGLAGVMTGVMTVALAVALGFGLPVGLAVALVFGLMFGLLRLWRTPVADSPAVKADGPPSAVERRRWRRRDRRP